MNDQQQRVVAEIDAATYHQKVGDREAAAHHHFVAANHLFAQRAFPEAIACYKRALAHAPDDHPDVIAALLQIGRIYTALACEMEAGPFYTAFLALAPADHPERAAAEIRASIFDEDPLMLVANIIQCCREAEEANPNTPEMFIPGEEDAEDVISMEHPMTEPASVETYRMPMSHAHHTDQILNSLHFTRETEAFIHVTLASIGTRERDVYGAMYRAHATKDFRTAAACALHLAVLCGKDGMFFEVLGHCREVAKYPELPPATTADACRILGNVCQHFGLNVEATARFARALQIAPDDYPFRDDLMQKLGR